MANTWQFLGMLVEALRRSGDKAGEFTWDFPRTKVVLIVAVLLDGLAVAVLRMWALQARDPMFPGRHSCTR